MKAFLFWINVIAVVLTLFAHMTYLTEPDPIYGFLFQFGLGVIQLICVLILAIIWRRLGKKTRTQFRIYLIALGIWFAISFLFSNISGLNLDETIIHGEAILVIWGAVIPMAMAVLFTYVCYVYMRDNSLESVKWDSDILDQGI